MQNQRFLKALQLQPVDKTPIWIMRQSGRYLPEYQVLRQKAETFLNLCRTPEFACEATLLPLRRFDLDAAIIFSDILMVPYAMGMSLDFLENQGPVFSEPLRDEKAMHSLNPHNAQAKLTCVLDAIYKVLPKLSVPLIGFSGSPWTLAAYMIEGSGSHKGFVHAKKMLYCNPQSLHHLLNQLTQVLIDFLYHQVEAGVSALMMFDTWGGLLGENPYKEFSLYYLKKVIQGLKQKSKQVPIILYAKQAHLWQDIAAIGCDGLSIDWTHSLQSVRIATHGRLALQGNLDPHLLYADPCVIQQAVHEILQGYGPYPGHIFNLGHGILPDMPLDNVKFLIECVHNFKYFP